MRIEENKCRRDMYQAHKYISKNLRLMKIMGVDENDVEDVATEVFIDAFRGLDNLRDPEKLVPWLKKIARNRASKYFRKRAKRKEISNMIKTEMG